MVKRLNILIVEDEFISRTLLREILTPFGRCSMVVNGEEAVDVLQESYEKDGTRYDLVCLDIMMPGKNGHQVLQELRRIEREKGLTDVETTKVLMVTALDDAKNITEAFDVGKCQAYLTKPVSKTRLEKQLRDLHLIGSTP